MDVSRDIVGPSVPSRIVVVCLLLTGPGLVPRPAEAVTLEGDITYTSDYVLRGISETGGRPAGQVDLHMTTADGTFAGVFASTLSHVWHIDYENVNRGWNYELEEYLGHRFNLSPYWSSTLTAVNYSYLDGNTAFSSDYQELSAAFSYLDSLSVTLAAIPNAIRYNRGNRLGRYPAVSADAATQLPIVGRLFLTAGVGYYASDHSEYAYGNAGLAFEFKSLRLDAGYYFTPDRAQTLFPYGRAGSRFAGSVSWHF